MSYRSMWRAGRFLEADDFLGTVGLLHQFEIGSGP